ncbi:bifunctional diguanylate cyclase/phosphodiesterase [Hyphomicrobium sp.]|uniref:bifunctional diguanylate cyclase/phosphodiesterase n=1 Tax=Hyphomicrobium sp. TaxID=82 RepID=UPI002E3632E1|nr:EAL domain-containing protein [Hyphomicrobium sp.]HEX2840310.1 EAL domain-containing protein [Hyphomicrobium sp.]
MRVLSCIVTEHNLLLVALAALICALGAWMTIRLLARARTQEGGTSAAWIFLGGVAAGSSIWCTHFVAMLAYESPTPVTYEPELTALSLAIVIATSIASLWIASRRAPLCTEVGGATFGGGVTAMHYVGMAAFSVDAAISWNSSYLVASMVCATAISGVAFRFANSGRPGWSTYGAIAILVLAVVSLHFTGMAAMTIMPYAPLDDAVTGTLAREMLAFAVTGVGLLVVGIVGVCYFIDTQMREQSTNRLRHLAESSADGMLIEHNKGIIIVNAAFETLSGFTRADLIGRAMDAAGFSVDALSEGGIVRATLTPKQGDNIPVEIAAHSEDGGTGEADLRVYALRDIRPRLEQERKIADLARIDSLTGLPNRMAFLEHLHRVIDLAGATRCVSLVAIDLNRFKEVNDLYGHAAGDTVLQVLSARMRAVLRDGEVLARLGGDEFVAVQTASDRDKAADLASRLETILYSLVSLELSDVSCGGSLGIAIYPAHASNATALMNNADLAMYRAKASHSDNICFYEEDMDEAMRARRRTVQELRGAITRNEFELRFQVQVSASTEEISGYEVLLRWKHPERGYVSPVEFIPIAEESGLIVQIGEWVLREACREAANWPIPHKIAVNLSAVQLGQPNLPDVVGQILTETGLPPSRLEFEVTETSLIQDMERTVHILARLKALGITIAMDDFGTGYSSLSTLRAFRFDKIKLDKSFVDDIETEPQARAVMLAVMALAAGLDIPVLAEGVESREQFTFVRASGCKEVQGFLFGRPTPTIETERAREEAA